MEWRLEYGQSDFFFFTNSWTNSDGGAYYGIAWWFDGTNGAEGISGWAQLTNTSFTGYYSTKLFELNRGISGLNSMNFENIISKYITSRITAFHSG